MMCNKSIKPLMKRKKQPQKYPIGIFDSGFGGISVLNEVVKLLPGEAIIYFGDSANCPYGEKSAKEVIRLSEQITEFLIAHDCKLIITACNTATGLTIRHLRRKYDIPFIGIEPAIKPAAQASETGHIGILATRNTFRSDHFINTKNQFARHVVVHKRPGIGLVEAVEKNQIMTESTKILLQKYLAPMICNNIDALVLGCTHFPFLEKPIKQILPDSVEIYNPAPAIAVHTKNILTEKNILSPGPTANYQFFTTGDAYLMQQFIENNFVKYEPDKTTVSKISIEIAPQP